MESLESFYIELPIICELLQILEHEKFSSQKLRTLAGSLMEGNATASRKIHRLQHLIGLAKARELEWFAYPSFCLLWGTQFDMAIEPWRQLHGNKMLEWAATLGEFEALLSLSTYSYEHPGDHFPEIVEGTTVFKAKEWGIRSSRKASASGTIFCWTTLCDF